MARKSLSKIHAEQGIQIGTSSTAGHILTAIDTNGNVDFQAKPSYTFRTQHTFAIAGELAESDTLPTFFVGEASSGQAVSLVAVRYKTRSGTVDFRLLLNSAEFGHGTTAAPLQASSTAITNSDIDALAENDEIELDILASSLGMDLSVTLIFEHVVS